MNRKLHFTVTGRPGCWRTHRILELCDYLTVNVLVPLFEKEGVRWDRRFMNFFEVDNGCDPLEPTGLIKFKVPAMFRGRILELEMALRSEVCRLGIELGTLTYEQAPGFGGVQQITIPIEKNPTALSAPPDVNMSHTRGCLVLRDLLGYQRVNGRYEFAADDLINRLGTVTEQKIAECTASPVKEPEGLRRTPSAMSMKAIRRCLEEVRQFAQWALRNNHPRLAAV